MVFDASSKTVGPSLNECLYAGPSLSPLLVDIMLRFHIFRVALAGDLGKAFLNVSVHPDDRNVLRFLWVSDVHSDSPEIVVKRFRRLVFGVSASSFLLNGTLEHQVKKYQDADPEFVQRFLGGLYVDDLSPGDESVDKSFQLYLKSKFRMLEAGFNMRKWSSSSPELMEMIKECEHKDQTQVQLTPAIIQEDTTYASNTLGPKHEINEDEEHKVLGITWNHKTDELIMCFDKIVELAETLPLTKRTMLKVIASVYDPLGWISPIEIPMKVLFQALCRCKQQWDAPLEADLKRKFENWWMELRKVKCIRLNRYYLREVKGAIKSLELHGYSDASNSAYAAAVYLKAESERNTETLLAGSRTRVAPLEAKTTPRLELLGAVILSRLVTAYESALQGVMKVDKILCLVDSTAVLYWILGSEKEWKQFVQNRIMEIKSLIPKEHWRYCPGELNPADLPT